jgi:ABC-type sulfate transport system substrate-binding protein
VARIVALAPDLLFASRIEATLGAAGHEVRVESTVDTAITAAAEAEVVIVDLHCEGLDPTDFAKRVAGSPLLGFYSHVDVDVRRKAEAAGFDLVVPRSRMAREMPSLVSRVAAR